MVHVNPTDHRFLSNCHLVDNPAPSTTPVHILMLPPQWNTISGEKYKKQSLKFPEENCPNGRQQMEEWL